MKNSHTLLMSEDASPPTNHKLCHPERRQRAFRCRSRRTPTQRYALLPPVFRQSEVERFASLFWTLTWVLCLGKQQECFRLPAGTTHDSATQFPIWATLVTLVFRFRRFSYRFPLPRSTTHTWVTGFVSLLHAAPSVRQNVFFDIASWRRRGVLLV